MSVLAGVSRGCRCGLHDDAYGVSLRSRWWEMCFVFAKWTTFFPNWHGLIGNKSKSYVRMKLVRHEQLFNLSSVFPEVKNMYRHDN